MTRPIPAMQPPPQIGPAGGVLDPQQRYTDEQVRSFYWHRPAPTAIPGPGQRVFYRHQPGDQALPVTVDTVRMDDRDDPNVYDQTGRVRPDPAPVVEFFYLPAGVRVACREARVPGSAGWSWESE